MRRLVLAVMMIALAGPLRAQSELDQAVVQASLAALDNPNSGQAEAVHATMAPELQSGISQAALVTEWDQIRSALGQVSAGGVARVTWYDDPAGAGRLAAADFGLRYPSDHMACGFLLWAVDVDGRIGALRRLDLTWLPPEMVTLPRDQFVEAFQSTPCKALPSSLLEPSQ